MKLLLKFNLAFLLVFAVGLAAVGYVTRTVLRQGANDQVLDGARVLMENAMAVSTYTATQVAPLLQTQMKYTFLPQSVPAFSATEVLAEWAKGHGEYSYKTAMLNPTNPRDRAQDWEEDIIKQFRAAPTRTEFIGHRDTPSGPTLYIARPIKLTNPACLQCQSTVEAAPAAAGRQIRPGQRLRLDLARSTRRPGGVGADLGAAAASRPRAGHRHVALRRLLRVDRRGAQPAAVAARDPPGTLRPGAKAGLIRATPPRYEATPRPVRALVRHPTRWSRSPA